MTQKDNVKQLIGKSLNAYNNKVLQQIDKIEKKNKQQNHKISMLTNELDNDYLTKTEEGSIISLEHSKEGMVYLDELQGNTLVNYCTDGAKELTLNGDIDLEGTFVTTTEGVDNGKVDVVCEGNTMVNLLKDLRAGGAWVDNGNKFSLNIPTGSGQPMILGNLNYELKKDTVYTVILNVVDYTTGIPHICFMNKENNRQSSTTQVITSSIGLKKFKLITKSDVDSSILRILPRNGIDNIYSIGKDILILEGDWSDRETPPYFEGMKSVGQDDENGHKIEILSRNKNLIHSVRQCNSTLDKGVSMTMTSDNTLEMNGTTTNSVGDLDYTLRNSEQMDIYLKPNKDYVVNFEVVSGSVTPIPSNAIKITDLVTGAVEWRTVKDSNKVIKSSVNPRKVSWIRLAYSQVTTFDNYKYRVQIEEGNTTTSYVKGLYNKKEILLNEPLRKANDNVKDRFVKIGGKLYIERNCKQLTITGNEPNVVWRSDGILGNVYRFWSNNFPNCITLNTDGCVFMGSYEGVRQSNAINIQISTSKIVEDNVELFVEYLKQNPLTLVIKRDKPTYEPLEINPELICYNDTTHISNNSIIPCNMKVKNSGYNVIIKPSTLYTVVLDTNKSGTIGMNLGGAKGTTTNNVLTLTTPATLTDDSLRLYGKGIKGSKVRLLEGDKTNWIPSFFEGMKSCFEDKVQDDGTYKMEILSNNINLFDKNIFTNLKDINKWVGGVYKNSNVILKLKPNTKYTMSIPELYVKNNSYWIFTIKDESTPLCSILNWSHNNSSNSNVLRVTPRKITFTTKSGYLYVNAYMNNWNILETMCEYLNKDFMLVEGTEEKVFVENKSNKIQFSSIEPLRGVDDVKDRFVFKDGKLMIERNCGKGVLGGEISNYHCWNNNPTDIVNGYIYYNEHIPPLNNVKTFGNVKNNLLPSNQGGHISKVEGFRNTAYFGFSIHKSKLGISDVNAGLPNQPIVRQYFNDNPLEFIYQLAEPTYEEIPYELQKIILEGYENGTLFFDTNIPPTATVRYAGETPIVNAIKSNKSNIISNTQDINDNIIPYLMDMDYRVVCLQLATETQGISMARLFGGTYEMLKRDILSKRYSVEEYKYRLDAYLSVNKITEKEYEELGEMLNE